jgi:PAS domain S-box-containing protein
MTHITPKAWSEHLEQLWRGMTEPVVQIKAPEQYHESRLLASLLLGTFLVGAVITLLPLLVRPDAPWAASHTITGVIQLSLVLALYGVSRRGHYRIAVQLAIPLGTILIMVAALVSGSEQGLHALYYLTIVLVFTAMFRSSAETLLIAAAQIGLMGAYAAYSPEIVLADVVLGPLIFNTTVITLILLFTRHRQRLDQALQHDLRASEERYRMISEMISDYAYAFRVEPDGTLVREWLTEDSFTRIMGYPITEVSDSMNLNFYHPEEQKKVPGHLAAVLRGETRSDDYRVITKSGEVRWLRMSRFPVWDEQAQRVVRIYGVAQDITDQRQADQQQFEMALARERFDLTHRFFRAISHDFRTSLSIIATNRYLIQKLIERGETADVFERLDLISAQVGRLTQQLENLKVVSSLSSPSVEACNLNDLAALELTSYQQELEAKQISWSLETDTEASTVRANPQELRRAIGHLLENALNFTPPGGRIELRVYHKPDWTLLDVRDTGIGISEIDQPHIFEFFFRGDEARSIASGGVGLGLSIVKMIIEAYGGQVSFQSRSEGGSTFTLALPALVGTAPNLTLLPESKEPALEAGSL